MASGLRIPPSIRGGSVIFFYNKTLMGILFCVRLKTERDKWFATAFGVWRYINMSLLS
jgi:hypothetical protein